MTNTPISFEVTKRKPGSLARAGVLHTPHGDIETPAFIVVGTKGTVKSLKPDDLHEFVGNQATLANTYHLYLQPGHELIERAGGLHAFMRWDGPLMTDSGGFQVFSLGAAFGKGVTKFATGDIVGEQSDGLTVYSEELAGSHGKLCQIDEDGVTFTSHLDGSLHRFTAERSIEIQQALGADIIVAFDECTSPTAPKEYQLEAMERTHRWAKRSVLAHKRNYRALKAQGIYGVVQGGRYADLRTKCARVLAGMDFDGFGIGGSFTKDDLDESLRVVNKVLPEDKPRHLLGIGEPEDIIAGVEAGCDTFDCVAPTRLARTGTIYVHTHEGIRKQSLMNAACASDLGKPDPGCDCHVCTHYSRAYLAHLFRAKEMLGAHFASIHNLHLIVNFTKYIRESILSS